MQVFQIDENGILMGDGLARDVHSKGHLQVLVAPPSRPAGHLARWVTEMCPVRDVDYGMPGTGDWLLEADHRKTPLYLTADGQAYALGTETEQGSYSGWGDLPAWLTDIERPGRFHNWVASKWVLDKAAELADAKAAKLLEVDRGRNLALAAGFEYDGNVFDSDDKSIQRISSIATLALMDPTFSTPYITKANITITLYALAIAGLGVAAAQHEASMIFQARALKDQVLVAEDRDAVAAISWVLPES